MVMDLVTALANDSVRNGKEMWKELVDAKGMGELEHLLQLQSGKPLECSEAGIGAI